MPDCIFIDRYRQDMSLSALQLWLRSAVGERGKWSEGRREAISETQPQRNVPPSSRRRKPAALVAFRRMPTRDERAVCGMWSEGGGATPARKPCVGHGEVCGLVFAPCFSLLSTLRRFSGFAYALSSAWFIWITTQPRQSPQKCSRRCAPTFARSGAILPVHIGSDQETKQFLSLPAAR